MEHLFFLKNKPSKWVKYGNAILGVIVFILFLLANFIKYPDTIQSEVELNYENPMQQIIMPRSGYLQKILVINNTPIHKNEILAVIDNSESFTAVSFLEKKVKTFSLDSIKEFHFPMDSLGEIQSFANDFYINILQYKTNNDINKTQKRIHHLQKEIQANAPLINKLNQQINMKILSLNLDKIDLQRDSISYFADGTISKRDYEVKLKNYIQQKQNLIELNANADRLQLNLLEKQNACKELEVQNEMEQAQYKLNIEKSKTALSNAIHIWKKQNVLASEIDGTLNFATQLKYNQYYKAETEIFQIIPSDSKRILAYANVEMLGSGKIKVGNKVLISLLKYPSEQYGKITGNIIAINAISINKKYEVVIAVQNTSTTLKKDLNYTPRLFGYVEIITDDKSIIERIVETFRKNISQ